jgi:vacuolar protein sorting-associated protein 33A
LLVPRTSELVTRILEEEGILGDVSISAFNLQFIPIAEDVISLENKSALKDLWVVCLIFLVFLVVAFNSWDVTKDGNETVIFDSMEALVTLQKLYGRFPRIIGKGDYAAVSQP